MNQEYKNESERDNWDDNYNLLSHILHNLCVTQKRQLTIFLPEDKNEVIPYLKKEIIKLLEEVQ